MCLMGVSANAVKRQIERKQKRNVALPLSCLESRWNIMYLPKSSWWCLSSHWSALCCHFVSDTHSCRPALRGRSAQWPQVAKMKSDGQTRLRPQSQLPGLLTMNNGGGMSAPYTFLRRWLPSSSEQATGRH